MVLEILMTRFELFWIDFRDDWAISAGKPRAVPMIVYQIGTLTYSSWWCCYDRGVGRYVLQIDSYVLRAIDMYSIGSILVLRLHYRIAYCRLMLSRIGPTSAYLHSWIVFFTGYLWVSCRRWLFVQVYNQTGLLRCLLLLFQWIIQLELRFWELQSGAVRWHHRSRHFTWRDMCGRVLHLL